MLCSVVSPCKFFKFGGYQDNVTPMDGPYKRGCAGKSDIHPDSPYWSTYNFYSPSWENLIIDKYSVTLLFGDRVPVLAQI